MDELGLELPPEIVVPEGVVLPFDFVNVRGDRAIVSGHGPQAPDGQISGPFGQVGTEVTVEEVEVRGTTYTTFADSSRISWAATTITGRFRPASRPFGEPRWRSTTSPEVSIEPAHLVLIKRCIQVSANTLLAQTPCGDGHCLTYRRAAR